MKYVNNLGYYKSRDLSDLWRLSSVVRIVTFLRRATHAEVWWGISWETSKWKTEEAYLNWILMRSLMRKGGT
jgi:hypothetical protein